MSALRKMTHAAWLALGEQLYGPEMREWKFRCPSCGHVQSAASVRANNPKLEGSVSPWIYFCCEGRYTPGQGCDWTLGGLFQIHRLVVVDGADESRAFEFADDPANEPIGRGLTQNAGAT